MVAVPGEPLAGLLVLEVANWIAAPSCGALFADLGAEVIKVEAPEGDSMRYTQRQPLSPEGKSQANGECLDHGFTLDNRGKKSISVNLADAKGQSIVRELAQKADILITNLLPRRLSKYGISYDVVREVNPRIIYVSVTGWGLLGPDADKPAFDMTSFFARGGVMDLLREPGCPPLKPRSGAGDHQTGLAAFSAVMVALFQREKTGKGSFCETSLLRNATWSLGQDLAPCLVDRRRPPNIKHTEDNPMARVYQTSDDRWLIVCMPFNVDSFWPKFCTVLGRKDWLSDDRYGSHAKRMKLRVELGAAIQDIFLTDTLSSWLKRLEEGGCIAGPVAEISEVVDDIQLRANGAFQQVHHPVAGTFETIAAPFNISGVNVTPRGPAPEPGADTQAVLQQHLGLTATTVQELISTGVVGYRPIPGSALSNWTKRISRL